MSDGDEKKPVDDDELSFLEELSDLIDEDLTPTDDAGTQSGGGHESPNPFESVRDAIDTTTDQAAKALDKEFDFVTDEAEEIVDDAEERVEAAVDTAKDEIADTLGSADELELTDDELSLAEPRDIETVSEEAADVGADTDLEFEAVRMPASADAEPAASDEELVEFLEPPEDVGEVVEMEEISISEAAASTIEQEGGEGIVPFEPWSEVSDEGLSAPVPPEAADQEVAELESIEADAEPLEEAVEEVVDLPEVADELEEIEISAAELNVEKTELGDNAESVVDLVKETVDPAVAATAADDGDVAAKMDKEPTKPFELREPQTFDRMAIAPAVPSKRSAVRTLLMVGLGLVIGAIALQLGLWWGLGKDPLGLAKFVPSWVMPSSLRSDSLAAAPQAAPATIPPSLPDDGADRLSADLEAPRGDSTGAQAADPLAGFPTADEGSGTTETDVATGGSGTSEPAAPPSSPDDDDRFAAAPAASPLDKPGPRNAAVYTRNELASAIALARSSDEKLDDARVNKSPDLRAAAEEFYRAFANLGEKATYVRRAGAAEVLSSSRDLLSSFEFDDRKQRMIANASRNWIKNELGVGVFSAANVTNIQPMGSDLYEVSITLMGKAATPVTVLTRLNPENNDLVRYSEGDRVLFLGTIVKRAKERIKGYTGMDDSVIWITDQVVTIP